MIDTEGFWGLRVLESPYMEIDGPDVPVRRTWRDRLFSRPWRPWVATRLVRSRIPHPGFARISPTTIVMHPETARVLHERLRAYTGGV